MWKRRHVKFAVEQMCDQVQKQFKVDRRPTRLLWVSDDGHFSSAFALTIESRLNLPLVHISSLRAAAAMLEAGRKVDLMLVDGHLQNDVVEQVALFLQNYPVTILLLLDESNASMHFGRMTVVNRADTEGVLSAIVYGLTVGF